MNNDSYELFCDGASKNNPGPAGLGCVLYDPDKKLVFTKGKKLGIKTNNEAEYMSLIFGLTESLKLDVKNILVKMDSNLVVSQVSGKWKINNQNLKQLYIEAKALTLKFDKFKIEHIYRENNKEADKIASQMALS